MGLRCLWRMLIASVFAVLVSIARAQEEPHGKVSFHLGSDEFPKAILEFYHQSKIEVLFLANDSLSLIHTQPVVGEFEPGEALERMLKGTGLTFKFATEHSVTIKQPLHPDITPPTSPAPQTPAIVNAPSSLRTVTIIANRLPSPEEIVISAGAEVINITRPDIDMAGAQTAAEAIAAIPQNWHGGVNEDTYLGEGEQNTDKAAGANIRGLNNSATQVLWNGHYMAPSGLKGGYEDISAIPAAAIGKIQLLPDSISITQSGDAVGGVVNFVTNREFRGSQTDVAYGHVSSGPMGELRVAQLEGAQWDGGDAFLALEYYHRGDLPTSYRARAQSDLTQWGGENFDTTSCSPASIVGTTFQNLCNVWHGASLLPERRHYSALGTLRTAIDDRAVLSVDLLLNERHVDYPNPDMRSTFVVPATNPYIPVGLTGPLLVGYDFSSALGQENWSTVVRTATLAPTLNVDFGRKWSAQAQAGWAIETVGLAGHNMVNFNALSRALESPNPLLAFDPFSNPTRSSPETIDQVRTLVRFDSDSQVRWVNLRFTGPAASLPGGNATITLGGEFKDQILNEQTLDPTDGPLESDFERNVESGFLETQLPLAGSDSVVRRIDLSAGLRYDRYTDAGGVGLPQFTARWMPLDTVSIKASWQRAARAPDLPDLSERGNISALFAIPDSTQTNRTVLVVTGGNASLRPESADSWTLELEAQPRSVRGLAIGTTFFDTRYTNKVAQTDFELNILQDPALAYAVIRNPSPQQRADVCQNSAFSGTTESCLATAIYALIDARQHNVAQTWTDGIDLYARYAMDAYRNHWDFGLEGTYIFDFKEQQTPGSDAIQLVNTVTNPIALRARAYATFKRRSLEVSGVLNLSGAYDDRVSQPERHVPAWATVDFHVSYEPIQRWTAALNVQNLANSMSPFVNNSAGEIGFDQENGSLLGRLWTLETKLRW